MKFIGIIFLIAAILLFFMALLSMFDSNVTRSVISAAVLIAVIGLLFIYLDKIDTDDNNTKENND